MRGRGARSATFVARACLAALGASACGGEPAGEGAGSCRFEIEAALSEVIPTVGVVRWSADLAGLSAARVEFTLNDAAPGMLNTGSGGPIGVGGSTHRALLLGLKPESTYTYRLVAYAGTERCVSEAHTLTTGAGTRDVPVLRTAVDPSRQARGFIVTSSGYGQVDTKKAFVIDADGDIVWWADAPPQCSRALQDFSGNALWMLDVAPAPTDRGLVSSVGMDGTDPVAGVPGFDRAHHDLVALPDGVIATLEWHEALDGPFSGSSDLVERSPGGGVRTVLRIDDSVFPASAGRLHANAVRYRAADDTYTVSDLYASAIIALTRQGELLWQVGGDCSSSAAPKCAPLDIDGNHGHEVLADGNLLLFADHTSTAYEYALTETETSLAASLVWSYAADGESSDQLGDVQRLPNGNTLVDFSTSGDIFEVSAAGDVVQSLHAGTGPAATEASFGYAHFRETLYGPPR
ncbi:MAG TPA: hypothetical protein VNN72_12100 [Polyangiaceae bacterium]|nr:hypothetical protein [Polyangiaceae bacterium]